MLAKVLNDLFATRVLMASEEKTMMNVVPQRSQCGGEKWDELLMDPKVR